MPDVTSIDNQPVKRKRGRPRKNPEAETAPPRKIQASRGPRFKPLDIPLPAAISKIKVTPKMLEDGSYGRKVLAHYAQFGVAKCFQSLLAMADQGSLGAINTLLTAFGVVQKTSTVSIVNNNNVDARSLKIETSKGEERSFEAIARIQSEEREKRYRELSPAAPQRPTINITPTPEGISS